MGRGRRALSAVALITAGTLAVHELRYALLPVRGSAPVHGYLPALNALAALLVLVALAVVVRAAGRPSGAAGPEVGEALPARAHVAGEPLSFRATWVLSSVALAALHVGQEAVEGLLSGGLPADPLALLGSGAPVAAAAALALGAVVALGLRGADAAVTNAAGRLVLVITRGARVRLLRPSPVDLPAPEPAGRHLAGRGPPLLTG